MLYSVTEVLKVHPQCMCHGLTVKQLGLLPNGKQINWSNLKKKSLMVYKDIKIKINEIFNECFYFSFLLVPRMLRHLSRPICSPAPNPNRLANNGW